MYFQKDKKESETPIITKVVEDRKIQYPDCPNKGLHEGEHMNLACLEPTCKKHLLACQECMTQFHPHHKYQSIKTLMHDVEENIIEMSGFSDPARLLQCLEESEKAISNSIQKLQNDFMNKTNAQLEKVKSIYNQWRDEIGKYSEEKQATIDLFNRIYNTNHTMSTLTTNLIEILELQDYQVNRDSQGVTPTTVDAFNKISKSHTQFQEKIIEINKEINEKLDFILLKSHEFQNSDVSSLVKKDDPYIFKAGEQEFKGYQKASE